MRLSTHLSITYTALLLVLPFFLAVVSAITSAPDTAAGYRATRGPKGITNGELIKRGLPPSRPRRLHQANKDTALEKRINGAPDEARASGGVKIYTRGTCHDGLYSYSERYLFTYTGDDLQSLADQCAAALDRLVARFNDPSAIRFFIEDRVNNPAWNCYINVEASGGDSDYPPRNCNTARYASYTLSS